MAARRAPPAAVPQRRPPVDPRRERPFPDAACGGTGVMTEHPAYQRTIFRDAEQQAFFNKFGYVITPYLDQAELAELNGMFEQTVRRAHETYSTFSQLRYYISVFDSDSAKRKALDGRVKAIFRDKVDRLMVDHRILLCNFMAKPPGAGEIEVHQDFSFVDEDHYVGFNLWVPLEDTDERNGCFYMLPGSHRALPSYRAASVPDTLTKYNATLKRFMIPMPIKAGHGILFDHRLFHYSPDNASDRWRPAVQLVVIPGEAQPVMMRYDKGDPDRLQVCSLDETYLTEENLWQPTRTLPVVGTKPYIPLPPEHELIKLAASLRAALDSEPRRLT